MKLSRSNSYPFAIAILVFGLFAPLFQHPFVNLDDPQNFYDNPYLRSNLLAFWSWSWTTGLLGVYQPLSWLALWVQVRVSGLSPHFIHAVSVVLHSAISLAVFDLGRTFWKGKEKEAALAALLFALHPLRVETVAWASCQPYLWSAFFGLVSTRFYLKSLRSRGQGVFKYRAASWSLLVLGLLCKAILFSLPAVFLLLRLWESPGQGSGPRKAVWRRAVEGVYRDWSYWGVSALTILAAVHFRGLSPQAAEANVPGLLVATIPLVVSGFAFWKTLLPWPLSPFNPLPTVPVIVSLVLASILLYAIWIRASRRREPLLYLGLVVWVLCLPGMSSAITERIAFADRFTYLPSIALALGSIPLLQRDWLKPSALALAGIYFSISLVQQPYWSDSELLWTHALRQGASRSAVAHGNLAAAYLEKLKYAPAQRSFLTALQRDPLRADLHNGLAVASLQLNDPTTAWDHLRTALQLKPDYPEALSNLGYIELQQGQFAAALEHTSRAVKLAPYFSKTHELRARIFEQMRNWDAAVDEAKQLVALSPRDPYSMEILGKALVESGQPERAIEPLRGAVSILSSDPNAHYLLAIAFSKAGFSSDARRELQQALLLEPRHGLSRQLLNQLTQ